MTTVLQLAALFACLACTAIRFPSMLKGRNRSLFWIFAMASLSVGLSIHAIYMPIDAVLGGINLANVLLRLSLFAVFFLLAAKVAAAYNSPLAWAMVRGPVGIAVLVICSLGIWVSYFFSTKAPSSTGLSALPGEPALTAYSGFGMAYMAYAAACVVVPTARATFARHLLLDRASAFLMCIGFVLVLATVPLQVLPDTNDALLRGISFSAVLFVAVGLALVWLSYLKGTKRRKAAV
ncbi:hypothetical protein JOF48_002597 [Arthrobacter stackebrandtii]|uniref:Uncharacterized protein n=1 Tax=Arthrobacter stackebrandtii TaxID=272161 RepID=A0ABS4YYE4_9MICC|nr:hypothetical protein [Arthrobacter stackebrandtii]MBP2413798.1 hypothetical protein [Arthrobacter stackebrandtii]PYH00381.1 hypothetical protein CVV67_09715 [Arthrobacter stackebrandtii]